MAGLLRGLGRTFQYGQRWWRWTVRDAVRIVLLLTVAASFAAVPAYNDGAAWASPVEFAGGVVIIVMFVGARWFWAGPTIMRARLQSDAAFRSAFDQLTAQVGEQQASRTLADTYR